MEPCREVDPLVTRVADGEATDAERRRVEAHTRQCAPCGWGLHAEREAGKLVRERGGALVGHAPSGLRARCTVERAVEAFPRPRRAPFMSRAGWPMTLAATLLLAVAGAALSGLIVDSSKAAAAQLALDHLKCFTLFEEPAGLAPAAVQAELKARHGIDIVVPSGSAAEGLTLVGGRRCVYLDGLVAHLLYRKGAARVSLFVLPTGTKLGQTEVDALGHGAIAFTKGGRTWVALARVPRTELRAIAAALGAGGI